MDTTSPSKKQLREFGLLVGFLFPLFIGWLLPIMFDHGIRMWTIFVGLPLIILGIYSPTYLKYFYKKWISFGNSLAFINSHFILGIVFILVLVPISFIMKLLKYDPLKIKKESLKTFREVRKYSKIHLEKIF
tara:strand:- start:235 stop:630 length:396 start_codon:yes stop_codon:yes gene_type:complete